MATSASRNALALTCCLVAVGCQTVPKTKPPPPVMNVPVHGAPPRHRDPRGTPQIAVGGGGESESAPSGPDRGPIPSDWKDYPNNYVSTRPAGQGTDDAGETPATQPATTQMALVPRRMALAGEPPAAEVLAPPAAPPETGKTGAEQIGKGTGQNAGGQAKANNPGAPASSDAAQTPGAPQTAGPAASTQPGGQSHPTPGGGTTGSGAANSRGKAGRGGAAGNDSSGTSVPFPAVPGAGGEAGATMKGGTGGPGVREGQASLKPGGLEGPGTPNLKDTVGAGMPAGGNVAAPGLGVGGIQGREPGGSVRVGGPGGTGGVGGNPNSSMPLPGGLGNGGGNGLARGGAGPELALRSPSLGPGLEGNEGGRLQVPGGPEIGGARGAGQGAPGIGLGAGIEAPVKDRPVAIGLNGLLADNGGKAGPSMAMMMPSGEAGLLGGGAGPTAFDNFFSSRMPTISEAGLGSMRGSTANAGLAFGRDFLLRPENREQGGRLMVPGAGAMFVPGMSASIQVFGALNAAAAPTPVVPKPRSRTDALAALRGSATLHVALWSANHPQGQIMTRTAAASEVETADEGSQFVVVALPGNQNGEWQTIVDQTNDALGWIDWLANALHDEMERREQMSRREAHEKAVRAGQEKLQHSVFDFLLGGATSKPADTGEGK